ncbi:MAG: hypothetical protein JW720_08350 [Sedimentisphaerales bacterium]|nr:hypothetical protein [Sedimentisphaerales bacterium]
MAERWIDRELESRVEDILKEADLYHKKYYESETFSGPSLHFHRRSLAVQDGSWAEKVELIYAVLASWGMHRMGAKGSKMQRYDIFENSVLSVKADIEKLRHKVPSDLSQIDWDLLEGVFKGIRVMASGTTIVGNSKVLAHILPKLVAPIDREYTLNYLFGNKMFQNDIEREWRLMRKILSDFYYPVACDGIFQQMAKRWMADEARFPWDTSILKVIDNLVIGAARKKNEAD